MGNTNSSNLSVGTKYSSCQEIIQEVDEYSHGQNKQNPICYNYAKSLDVICEAHYCVNKKIDDLHSKELREYVSNGGTKYVLRKKVTILWRYKGCFLWSSKDKFCSKLTKKKQH